MEVAADSRFGPEELPGDAILICAWRQDHPPRWEVAGVVSGAHNLDDALTEAGKQIPDLAGRQVMATKVGGKSSTVTPLKRTERTTVSVSLG